MSPFSWQGQNLCGLSLAFILDWRVVCHNKVTILSIFHYTWFPDLNSCMISELTSFVSQILWDLVDECGITHFGTSAKWIAVQEDKGIRPIRTHQLASLKAILSTGSPLKPNSYDYVYRDIKTDLLLASISGGTDIISCFMGEVSTLPVYRGEIQSASLVSFVHLCFFVTIILTRNYGLPGLRCSLRLRGD